MRSADRISWRGLPYRLRRFGGRRPPGPRKRRL